MGQTAHSKQRHIATPPYTRATKNPMRGFRSTKSLVAGVRAGLTAWAKSPARGL